MIRGINIANFASDNLCIASAMPFDALYLPLKVQI
jgi:hypothetical protein